MKVKSKPIFLSHASSDKQVADNLTDLLCNGCAVNPNDVLCSSLPGKGVPGGTPSFIDHLKQQLQGAKIVIFLLSENFFVSQFCLCELGATWAKEIAFFPLVLPPLEKSELGGTLEVTQAGDITDARYLDQFRDRIRAVIGTEVPTETWCMKRDVFLISIKDVLKSLPKPALVPRAELASAQEQYQAAVSEMAAKEKEIKRLKAQIAKLEEIKDPAQVRAVARQFSSNEKEFASLCKDVRVALGKLYSATCRALYWENRGGTYYPQGREEWDEVRGAEAEDEVSAPEGEEKCDAQDSHPRVAEANDAIFALSNFLNDEANVKFVKGLTQDRKFPIHLGNKEFWREVLGIDI
jgi:hypothetical protein